MTGEALVRHGVRPAVVGLVSLAVLLTACSSGGSGATESSPTPSSPTASAPAPSGSPAASPAPAGPVARDVPGYRLDDAPPAADAAFSSLISSSNGTLESLSTYTIFKDGRKKEIGGLVLFGVAPATVTSPELSATLAPALLKALTGGGETRTIAVSAVDVEVTETGGSTFAAWYDGIDLSLVIGSNRRQVLDFVKAYITAA
ncbi:MAG TPA: hypothetical protein VEV13_07905 [Candidatus Limnocylindria bacterium]|nr:hypothetical protein [Candidatus Limnocylindria bacterium]